jgi:Na+/H+-translocating membrane pyrophosphatase
MKTDALDAAGNTTAAVGKGAHSHSYTYISMPYYAK